MQPDLAAEKQVCLGNGYFVPDPQLLKAAVRGVDIRLILPSHSDPALSCRAGHSHDTHLLKGGVKIHARRGTTRHVKTAVIDGVWSGVGSSNLDWRSPLDNDDINAVMVIREVATQILNACGRDSMEPDWISLKPWERRSFTLRMKEWGARLWGRLLYAGPLGTGARASNTCSQPGLFPRLRRTTSFAARFAASVHPSSGIDQTRCSGESH